MPRKGPRRSAPLVNDPVYGSQLVTQLVNKVLLDGKKSLAERIVYWLRSNRPATRPAPIRWSPSSALWTTSSPPSRCAAAASVAPPTRCPSRSVRSARPR